MTPPGDGGDQPPDPDDPPRNSEDTSWNPDDPHRDPDDASSGHNGRRRDVEADDATTAPSDDASAAPSDDASTAPSDDYASTGTSDDRSPDATEGGRSAPASGASADDRPASNGGGLPAGATDTDGRDAEPRDDEERDGEAMDWTIFAYDAVSSAVAVLLVGALLFAVSGVWPPMVAVESPSMTPHMKTGDLVFVMAEERFPGEGAHGSTGVVTAQVGANASVDYRKFQRRGDVIVYRPRGNNDTTPIIHRAMFWVDEGENWYDEADRQAVGRYSECGDAPDEAMPNCPAPHAGFITKGDANSHYDQVEQMSGPVKPEWVVGTAEVRIPKLGCVRLRTEGCVTLVTGVQDPLAAVLPDVFPTVAGDPGASGAVAGDPGAPGADPGDIGADRASSVEATASNATATPS